jgi:hypothetical protein
MSASFHIHPHVLVTSPLLRITTWWVMGPNLRTTTWPRGVCPNHSYKPTASLISPPDRLIKRVCTTDFPDEQAHSTYNICNWNRVVKLTKSIKSVLYVDDKQVVLQNQNHNMKQEHQMNSLWTNIILRNPKTHLRLPSTIVTPTWVSRHIRPAASVRLSLFGYLPHNCWRRHDDTPFFCFQFSMITLSAIKQLLLTVSIPRIVVPSESSSYKDKTMATISNCYTYFFFLAARLSTRRHFES